MEERNSITTAFLFSLLTLLTLVPFSMFVFPTPLADLLGMAIAPGTLFYSLYSFARIGKPRSTGQIVLFILAIIIAVLVSIYNYLFIFGSGGPTFITDF